MEEQIKEIISVFIKTPVHQIGPDTIIDRSAVNSSIILHRMYAKLSEQGISVENYRDIKHFSTLLQRVNGSLQTTAGINNPVSIGTQEQIYSTGDNPPSAIGVDIEEVISMPRTTAFRDDAFYKMNYSATEIAYCILQQDPYASFAGLFAAKEAIVKASNLYLGISFNTIIIDHLPEGNPVHDDFRLSISHAGGFAVAVAIPKTVAQQQAGITENDGASPDRKSPLFLWLALLSLLLSAIAIILALKH